MTMTKCYISTLSITYGKGGVQRSVIKKFKTDIFVTNISFLIAYSIKSLTVFRLHIQSLRPSCYANLMSPNL